MFSSFPVYLQQERSILFLLSCFFICLPFLSLTAPPLFSIRSRTIRNAASARVSVPSLLKEEKDSSDPSRPWVWRTNLANTKHFWEGWFVGLSKKFLEAKGGKLLLLAGTDRLDKELMIGQMQGI
jgi:protein phosphatase methylesterase 1